MRVAQSAQGDKSQQRVPSAQKREETRKLGDAGSVNGWVVQRQVTSTASAAEMPQPEPASHGPSVDYLTDDQVVSLSPGQMRKGAFVAAVREAIESAAADELRDTAWSVVGCPWIERILRYYGERDAAEIEGVIRREVPGATSVSAATDYIPLIRARVVDRVRYWLQTREVTGVPIELVRDSLSSVTPPTDSGTEAAPTATDAAGEIVQRKSRARSADRGLVPSHGDPRALLSSLGAGQPIDSGVRGRFESAFGGADFSGVRIHTNASASAQSSNLEARAFTVGQHIAFGAGEYRPGTVEGDMLFAHELVHTVQQRGATKVNSSSGPERAESEANRVATMVVAAQQGMTAVEPVSPQSEGGLGLRRCIEPVTYTEDSAIVAQLGLQVTQDPELPVGTDALVGMQIHYGFQQRVTGPNQPFAGVYQWRMTYPGSSTAGMQSMAYPGNSTSLPITSAGSYTLEVEIRTSDQRTTTIRRTFNAIEPATRANTELASASPVGAQDFLNQQEFARTLLRPGLPTEQSRGGSWVDTSASNPVQQAGAPFILMYWVRSGTSSSSTILSSGLHFQWWAIPSLGAAPATALAGRPPITINGQQAYDLGTSSNGIFTAAGSGLFLIGCDVTDSARQVVASPRYLQSILAASAIAELGRLETSLSQARTNLAQIANDRIVPVLAVHVTTQSGQVMQPRLFAGPSATNPAEIVLVDATPGLDPSHHTLLYRGADINAALSSFESGNHYPTGVMSLRIDANSAGIPTVTKSIDTTGASFLDRVSMGLGIASALLLLGAIVAAPFTGGSSLLVGALMLGSMATGAAAAAVSLTERLQHATVSPLGVTVDCLAIVGSLIGAGTIIRGMAAGGNMLYLASTPFRMVLWTNLAIDGVAALLISIDGIRQIATILDRTDLTRSEQQRMILVVVTQLILTGALLAISYGSMNEMRTRLRTALGETVERTLTVDGRLVLSLLDDTTLRTLNSLGREDLERLAVILRSDPRAIASVQGRTGLTRALQLTTGSTFDELEWAFVRVRLQDHGLLAAEAETLSNLLRNGRRALTEVERIVALTPVQARRLLDASPEGLGRLLTALDNNRLATALGNGTGAEIDAVLQRLGRPALTRIIDDPNAIKSLQRLGTLGRALINTRSVEGVVDRAVGAGTLILDNNAQTVTRMLMSGTPWADLQAGQREIINRLRREAGLTALAGDPPDRSLRGILGTEDIVMPAVPLAEGARLPGVTRSGLAVSIGHDDPAWQELYTRLQAVPAIPSGRSTPVSGGGTIPVGGNKGALDQAMVADVFFGATSGPGVTPRFVTGDRGIFESLFAFNISPVPATAAARGASESLSSYINRVFPRGYLAEIPLPTSGRNVRAFIIPGL